MTFNNIFIINSIEMSKDTRRMNAEMLAQVRAFRGRNPNVKSIPRYNPRPTVKSVNRKVKKIENRQELKHKDVLQTNIEMTDTGAVGTILLLNALSIGNSNITRVGDRVSFTSIQIRGSISSVEANTDPTIWRVIVFRDMQTNGAAPLMANLLDTSVITQAVHAPYNGDYTDRFRIISDKKGTVNPNTPRSTTIAGAVTTNTTMVPVTIKYKLKWRLNFVTNYGLGNTGDVTDISKNSVYIILLSDQTAASNKGTVMTFGSRMYYKDD